MIEFARQTIIDECDNIDLIAEYEVCGDRVNFQAKLVGQSMNVIVKSWSRKILGQFDPESMLGDPNPQFAVLAAHFSKMDSKLLKIRMQTLGYRRSSS